MKQILGTINKRIDIGIEGKDSVFLISSSNYMLFSYDEMMCLQLVLVHIFDCEFNFEDTVNRLSVRKINLFEPAPPPATLTL